MSTKVLHAIGSCLPGGHIFGVRDSLNETDLSDRSLLFMVNNEIGPHCMRIVRYQGWQFSIVDIHFEKANELVIVPNLMVM